jgi:hypothetical protein
MISTYMPSSIKQAATYITKPAKDYLNLNKKVLDIAMAGVADLLGDPAEIKTVDTFDPSVVGLNNARSTEAVPNYVKSEGERVISNLNNSWIVLGRDRNASRASGYGGAAYNGASAIDLVVGRMADSPKSDTYADPNFMTDAARIYISQKADIDDYLNLTDGSVGNSTSRSAIGLKADSIRLASRQGIKLVTGTDDNNSFGGMLLGTKGIDLIAGNNDENLQAIPLGDNLVEAIGELKNNLSDLNAIVLKFLMNQMIFNVGVQAHTHAPSFGMAPSIELQPIGIITGGQINSALPTLWQNKVNMMTYDLNYLYPFGSKWICGSNRTN